MAEPSRNRLAEPRHLDSSFGGAVSEPGEVAATTRVTQRLIRDVHGFSVTWKYPKLD